MRNRRLLLALAAAAVSAALAFAVFRLRGASVETSIYAMLGDGAAAVAGEAREDSLRTAFVVFSSASASVSRAASEEFARRFPAGFLEDGAVGADPRRMAGFSRLADGLVAAGDYGPLATPEGRSRIARSAIRRYAASPVPPVFPPEDDPFCLKERFLMSFADSAEVVLPLRLREEVAADVSRLGEFKAAVAAVAADVQKGSDPSLRAMPCGVPLHTALVASRCRREIGWLSLFSSLFVVGVALWAFRPFSRVAYLVSSLLFSTSAGAIALFLYSPRFHVMTIVFGTTVIGLAADYSFHWLLHPSGDRRRTARNLAVSFLTTAIALSTLFFSSLPVLRESAVFLTTALAAALAFVAATHPGGAESSATAGAPPRFRLVRGALAVAVVALLGAAVFVVPRAKVETSPAALYVPPRELLEPEKVLSAKWAPPPPSVAADVAKLYAEHGGRLADALGLSSAPVPPARPQGGAQVLSDALRALTDETAKRLVYAIVAMLVVLAATCRAGALAVAAPSVVAFLVAVAAVTLSGEPINLFHLLAGFLLAGMCVDYTIFLRSAGRGSVKSATCSLLTSLAGFGALAFISFRPAAAFGLVLGTGLPAGFAAAFAASGRLGVARRGQKGVAEKAASPLGMEIVWLAYRLFGLGFMRAMARGVASCAWLFSPAVRRASPSRRKVAMFAQMLADKVAIVSGAGSRPEVRDDGSRDARDFVADVASGRGVFMLTPHCGSPEALVALAENPPTFHAWTDLGRTTAFNSFYFRHMRMGGIEFHDIADMGMETAFAAMQWLDDGECLVMAGDRGRGAFRFAAALGHPVYFATCVAEASGYVAVIRALRGGADGMEEGFWRAFGELERKCPEQVYEWDE